MRTYLVTGGAGFIGSNYIHYMFRKYDNEIRIINVDALTYAGNLENLKDIENRDNYTFIKADITDKDAIMKIFEENDIDRVVHFAAESHVDRSIKNPNCREPPRPWPASGPFPPVPGGRRPGRRQALCRCGRRTAHCRAGPAFCPRPARCTTGRIPRG